ncbi:LysR family transcriptional regulator [Vibrio breoganii]|uniref:LysR family transcriptional regulator n=1 Tax=Vibrio breoganii TaxID=553239 RepID=A0AAN1CTP7_9VIBR|nr:LysR family transcriptional regulator [Vibrio breoganii]ANO34564.1 LysR family transcriptional regulator [Vibrio breoganii]OED89830.1 LysR family transcriptional regulator [Vibrio breoganii ZF-55]PMG78271.1 LysR family transcriptional regulator [Vibrio breoganii]PMK44395.1 LysR family transcriptional regulator [Vibrio breoganii]PML04549.1 LysR family transcriptional regulator [Vibrio breoganii]
MRITDLNSLNVFLNLMQTHSTLRTAKKLGRSQSYISKVLAQLREELDDPLFTRSAEGLSPTSYAISIQPKIQNAIEQISHSLEPEEFSPANVDRVTLHILEPLSIRFSNPIIRKIRQETNAIIEVRNWTKLSENMILDEEVDLGFHILSDKPQTLYQKKLYTGSGLIKGNKEGEFVKYIASGVNEYENRFQRALPDVEATIFVDNYMLLTQLMDCAHTMRYISYRTDADIPDLDIDTAIVLKSSKRKSPKSQWLANLVEKCVMEELKANPSL